MICGICKKDVPVVVDGVFLYEELLTNIVPCCVCRDKVRVCRGCADVWVSSIAVERNVRCVVCERDRKLGEVLDGE